MKTINWISLAGVALLFTACIPSVNPFYTARDLTSDPRLAGEWQDKEAKQDPALWKFEALRDGSFQLLITEEQGKQGTMSAHLFKLKGELFLDLIPKEWNYATNQADMVNMALFPGHVLAHVVQLGPELRLAFFNTDWLRKYLEKNPKALAYTRPDEQHGILTASTRDLQRFVLSHLKEGELFGDPCVFVRRAETGAPQR
jgi:hypothetical protein